MVTCDYQPTTSTDLMAAYSAEERSQLIHVLAPFLSSYDALKQTVRDFYPHWLSGENRNGDRFLQEKYLRINEFFLQLFPDICETIVHPSNKPWAVIISKLMEKQTDSTFTILVGENPSFLSRKSLEALTSACSTNICQNQPERMKNAVVASLANVADRMRIYIDPTV